MKILLCSHVFPPSVGGTETVARLLAKEFTAAGHDVRVITRTPAPNCTGHTIIRRPSLTRLLSLFRWADVVFHNNVSLRTAWPLLVERRRWFVTHQTWLAHGGNTLAARLKKALLRRATNISISGAVARALPFPSCVIPNPYDADLFHVRRDVPRTRDLLFVGRLVSDKGCDLLLDALELLHSRGVRPTVTIVGDGPERLALEKRAPADVQFAGALQGELLARCYSQHRVLVVPSRWAEPFGIVALEAIASGCVVVGSSGGGLPEAIGRCGMVFRNENAADLATALEQILTVDPREFTKHAEMHLKTCHPSVIARRYLDLFENN